MTIDPRPVILVLAGGRTTRMGGDDKALRPVRRDDLARPRPGAPGGAGGPHRAERERRPGVLAGMEWVLTHAPGTADLVTVPTDSPFLPTDLAARLIEGRDAAGTEMACATSAGQVHPVVGLWPVRLAPELRRALVEERLHRIDRWTARFALAHVAFLTDPFPTSTHQRIWRRRRLGSDSRWV
jgi:molybdopterin-guanine dinucleotide biosynthesis protein A